MKSPISSHIKGAHKSGLGHFVRKVTRPFILIESIFLESRVGGEINGKVKGEWMIYLCTIMYNYLSQDMSVMG